MTNVTSLVEGQAPEEAEIVVICRHGVAVFLQADDDLIVLHVVRKVDTDTAYGVIYDPVEEERGIGHMLAHPVGVGALRHRPLQDVRLLDACEESVEVVPIRDQCRLFQKPTTAVVRRVVVSESVGGLVFQEKSVRTINFKCGRLLVK